MKIMLGDFTA